ncbi:kielin/chordin-like protein [Garra rufa]|uniref:kielin/chordin-like protein n=1 Tax=Garra rufa TaxID=137080 RepID=UPI003CCE77D6
MELTALVGGVFMSLLVLWNVCDSVQTHQDANHPRGADTVINLLKALNVTRSPRGVSKVKGRDPEMPAWRFRSSTPHLKLPQNVLDYLFNTSQGVLGLHLVGRQNKGSEATLISFTSSALLQKDERPLLELVSNTRADWLQLEFRSEDGLRTEVLKVPGGSPFTGGGWVRMAVSLEPRQIVLYVDCQDAVVLKLKEGGRILTLYFPEDLQVTFSSTAGKKASKFSGGWQTAELSTRAYEKRPWFCDNVTDSLLDIVIPTVPAVYDLDMMQDQGDRGDGIVSAAAYQVDPDARLGQLENNLHSIRTMLDMLKSQNTALQARVDYLETCECSKRKCVWEGRQMDEGSQWSPDSRTVCICTQGKVQCSRSNECSFHGNIYSNGDVFSPDDCNRCTCEHGRVECNVNPCPSQSCQEPSAPQETCCPVCQTRCEHEGEIYENGDVFVSRTNPCVKCSCSNSQVRCDPIQCQPTACPTPYRRPGECCPTCSACNVDGRPYNGSYSTVDGCQICNCQGGNQACVDVQRCPQTCQDGVKPPFGSCCRDCSRCDFEGQVILDGVSVQHSRDPCKRCVCNSGNIVCNSEPCPELPCNLVETVGGECCPRCRSCVQDNVRHQHGSEWKLPHDPCTTCTCTEGQVHCESERCNIRCRNPASAPPGSCCPVCDGCSVNGIDIPNGMTLPPGPPCDPTCRCENGNINCVQYPPCPPTPCRNPVKRRGECCARCEECSYEGESYTDGQTFVSRQDPCLRCQCSGGQVSCESASSSCPPPSCTHPTKPHDQCCPTCNTCEHEGRVYRNGEEFRPPGGGPCIQCSCKNGNVRCHQERCPALSCAVPTPAPPNTCCPVCRGCMWNGVQQEEGATWIDAGRQCACRGGQVTCSNDCPPSNPEPSPYPTDNCRGDSCGQCQYKQRWYENGQRFQDPDDACTTCHCQDGQILCGSASCPGLTCPNAYTPPGECCPQCPDDGRCQYNQRWYENGRTFKDPDDACTTCTCRDGQTLCSLAGCLAPTCANAYTPPGECCPRCPGCLWNGVQQEEGATWTDAGRRCSCVNGQVTCSNDCPPPNPVPCPNPTGGECCGDSCGQCPYKQRMYENGQTFKDPDDPCMTCTCQNGRISCDSASCSQPTCANAYTPPGECCPRCPVSTCEYDNRIIANGDAFPNPSNPCEDCVCNEGHVNCGNRECPRPNCNNPQPGTCCQNNCNGESHKHQAQFNGALSCERRQCPQQCTHPGDARDCCPVCDRCLFEGQIYGNTQTFYAPSDPCKRCVCQSGSVRCRPVTCPTVSCHNPITPPGQCCPQCRVCLQQGKEYLEGQSLTLPTDPCFKCTCVDGEMSCGGPECPKLTCMHQVTDPGSCCPRCRGCMYDGIEHLEGSTWFASSSPCMSCMCVNGVTTCSEVHCLSTCLNQISVPGECCPVCADCVYKGHVYSPGESFQPSDDPCQICTCEVMPDGEQHLRCYRKQCPSLVDCPKHNILYSGSDSCCPVCAQPLSNCTATLIGNEVLATDDPCFTCQCKDLTWTCIHRGCPPLSCPLADQHTPPDSCCPVCDECVLEGEQTRVRNGQRWTDKENECVTCICNQGHIECDLQECPFLDCPDGSIKVKNPGKCCPECTGIIAVVYSKDDHGQCVYDKQRYNHNDHWEVDECTSCTCVYGDVHCQTQRCPMLTCASDETPALVPGMCCPHCIPHPATCIVFGDPHYRTFDGKMVNFQGTCTYVLAQDCEGGDFSVHVSNEDRGRKGVSWTKEVTVFIGDTVVHLLQDWIVKVDYQQVSLPFLKEPYVYLERKTNTILLNTNVGLKVLWNGRSHLEVSVPGTYKKHMCGLCGNFNNYPQDDMKLRNGRITNSEAVFGNNWKVGSGNPSIQCPDAININPCNKAGYSAHKTANARCAVLKSPVFERCHKLVPPEMFYASCVYDMCACGSNTDVCLCDVLEAYASECREAGVILQWRSPTLCAVGCPLDRGYVFDECGPPCPKTCFNKDVPLGVIEAHCFKPCVPGCQCPAGLVEHNAHCIAPEKCPKIILGNLDLQTHVVKSVNSEI